MQRFLNLNLLFIILDHNMNMYSYYDVAVQLSSIFLRKLGPNGQNPVANVDGFGRCRGAGWVEVGGWELVGR